jgi:aspartate aminotransferase
LKGLAEIPGLISNQPGGAFYVFPDCSSYFGKKYGDKTIHNSDELCLFLLEEGLVALVGGESFGAPNCFRISYAASEETLTKALSRMKEALAKLN